MRLTKEQVGTVKERREKWVPLKSFRKHLTRFIVLMKKDEKGGSHLTNLESI